MRKIWTRNKSADATGFAPKRKSRGEGACSRWAAKPPQKKAGAFLQKTAASPSRASSLVTVGIHLEVRYVCAAAFVNGTLMYGGI